MLTTKNKIALLFPGLFLLISCFFYFFANRNAFSKSIECSSNIEVYHTDLQFKGVFIHRFYDRFGSTLAIGVVKKNGITVGKVNRRVNVEMQRTGNTVILTSTRIIKKEDDNAPEEDLQRLLPTYMYSDVGDSIYDFIKQDDGGFLIIRGTLPLAYCSN